MTDSIRETSRQTVRKGGMVAEIEGAMGGKAYIKGEAECERDKETVQEMDTGQQ